uniref:Uncharacterized protein n=1 Tax=Oncorhynchus tshawytscha TaxID=74940 RepID=A0A8C8BZ24_ONCTS
MGQLFFFNLIFLVLYLSDIGQTLQNILPFDHLFNHTNNEILRSLEVDDFKINVAPTSGKVSSAPTMVRLYPPPVQPLHLHANLPLRFGRNSQPDDMHSPKSTLNLPQRFGRAQGSVATFMTSCVECPRIGTVPSATLPPRFSRNEFYHSYPFRAMHQDYYIMILAQRKKKL